MAREKQYPLNPGDTKVLKAAIYDLSEIAAKQVLYGIIQIFSMQTYFSKGQLMEILDDARKLTKATKPNGI